MLSLPTDALRWELLDGSGWQPLLPSPLGPLLCYDSLGGATMLLLAGLSEELWVVHHDPGERQRLAAKVHAAGLDNVRVASLEQADRGRFDGVVIHDPLATVLRRDGHGRPLASLCAWAAAALRSDGFVYLGMQHRFSYTRLRRGQASTSRPHSVRAAARALRQAGFTPQRPWPLLLDAARVAEVVPEGGYRSAKNRFLATERLREIALGIWGSAHLAPGYALLGFRGAARPTWLERALADEWIRSLCPEPVLRRYLVLGEGKIVLSLGARSARHGTLIAVLAPDAEAAARRRAEARLLDELRHSVPAVAAAIPVFHGERALHGVTTFALSELPGITIDRNARFLPELTRHAARWLIELHRAARQRLTVDDEAFEKLFHAFFERARDWHPPIAPELARLETGVRAAVMGQAIETVWMHGDFKLENVVFDERRRTLRGVIDWELSRRQGLPLVDLLYLLLYNRVIRGRQSLLEAARTTLLGDAWTAEERGLLGEYQGCFPATAPVRAALDAMFLVHHVGCRFKYDLGRDDVVASLRALLVGLGERLAAALR